MFSGKLTAGMTRIAVWSVVLGSLPVTAAAAIELSNSTMLLTPRIRAVDLGPSALAHAEVAKLRRYPVVAYEHNGLLIILARSEGGGPVLNGTLSGTLRRVATPSANLWGIAFEIEDLRSAIIDIAITADSRSVGYTQFRGHGLGPAPPDALRAGVVERRAFVGFRSGLRRDIAIYRPRNPAGASVRILYVLDRAEQPDSLFRRIDQLIDGQIIKPLLVVALPAGSGVGAWEQASQVRLQERVAGLNPEVYRRYETFVLEDLIPTLAHEFRVGSDPDRRAVVGASASATWVLDQARRHGRIANIWGAFALPDNRIARLPDDPREKIFMGGGTLDLDYLARGLTACAQIRRGGGRCRFAVVNSGHGQGAWDELIADLLIDWDRRTATK